MQQFLISGGFRFSWTPNQSSDASFSCRTFWLWKTLLVRVLLGVHFFIQEVRSQLVPIVYFHLEE